MFSINKNRTSAHTLYERKRSLSMRKRMPLEPQVASFRLPQDFSGPTVLILLVREADKEDYATELRSLRSMLHHRRMSEEWLEKYVKRGRVPTVGGRVLVKLTPS